MINIAQWDTDNFGIKIGNLIIEDEVSQYALQKEIEYAKSLGYELLYLKGLTLPEDCISENVVLADEKNNKYR